MSQMVALKQKTAQSKRRVAMRNTDGTNGSSSWTKRIENEQTAIDVFMHQQDKRRSTSLELGLKRQYLARDNA